MAHLEGHVAVAAHEEEFGHVKLDRGPLLLDSRDGLGDSLLLVMSESEMRRKAALRLENEVVVLWGDGLDDALEFRDSSGGLERRAGKKKQFSR